MLRDGYSNFKFFQALVPQEIVAADLTGVAVDGQGFESLTMVVNVGRLSIISDVSYIKLILQHTDASALGAGPSDYALVSATDLIGLPDGTTALTSGVWKTIGATNVGVVASTLGSMTFAIGYRGTKRYVRLYVDCVGTVALASDAVGAIAVLGYPANWPVNNNHDSIDYSE